MSRSKFWAALVAAFTVAMATSLSAPTDARADRCNPDEMAGFAYKLITGQEYEPVFGQDQGPFCEVMKTVVYPAIGCDPASQNLPDCVMAQPARVLRILNDQRQRLMWILNSACSDPSGEGCGPPCGGTECGRP